MATLRRDGYTLLPPCLPPALLAELRAAAPANAPVLANPHRTTTALARALTHDGLHTHIRAVLGSRVFIENSFVIVKHPGTDMTVPAHQDGTNERLQLDPARALTVWIALSEATTDAGCVHVIAGSHRRGYAPTRRADTAGRPLTLAAPATGPWTAAPVPAGGVLLMDVRTIHYSPPNHTPTPRVGVNVRLVAPGGCLMRDGTAPTHLVPLSAADR
ncbi:phytanoyl-CoA dioxygenase family protein [Nocardiopsis synnemataformans]|uniref:phytanoyl-CoA dioxygenase family protein n=1 Tax=Nocardiopsis synnemataformans TaxID=61305 RepID=UPI003EBF8DDC